MDANSVLADTRTRQGLLLGHLKRPLAVAHAVHQLNVAPVVPQAGTMRDERKATAEVEGFLKQASKFSVSFGGQRSIQLSYGRLSVLNRRNGLKRQRAVNGRSNAKTL